MPADQPTSNDTATPRSLSSILLGVTRTIAAVLSTVVVLFVIGIRGQSFDTVEVVPLIYCCSLIGGGIGAAIFAVFRRYWLAGLILGTAFQFLLLYAGSAIRE